VLKILLCPKISSKWEFSVANFALRMKILEQNVFLAMFRKLKILRSNCYDAVAVNAWMFS